LLPLRRGIRLLGHVERSHHGPGPGAPAPAAGGGRRPGKHRPRAPRPRLTGRTKRPGPGPPGGGPGDRTDRRGARMSLRKVLAVALGILSAIGGFVDIGDLVFNTQAGATFRFQLLWVVVIG